MPFILAAKLIKYLEIDLIKRMQKNYINKALKIEMNK